MGAVITQSLLYPQQLQLLQKVQEAQGIVAMAVDFVGDQNALEATLADVLVITQCY